MFPVAASLRLTPRILPPIAFVLLASCRGLSYAVLLHVVICPRMEWMRCFVHMMWLTRYAAVVIQAYLFVCAKYLVCTRALIPVCRFLVIPVMPWSRCAYMSLTHAKSSVYLLSASSCTIDLSLWLVCVLWEPDPSLVPMRVLQHYRLSTLP